MKTNRILIVEDEAIIAADLERRLIGLGYEAVGICATGKEACNQAAELRPDLVLMDIVLRGELSGIEAARVIREREGIPVVFLTAHADTATVDAACRTEPHAYLLKPLDDHELRIAIKVVLQKRDSEMRSRRVEHWLAATLRSISDAVITTDRESRITFLNLRAEELTGWQVEEAVLRPLAEILALREIETHALQPDPALTAITNEITVNLRSLSTFRANPAVEATIESSTAPIRDFNGVVCGAVLVCRVLAPTAEPAASSAAKVSANEPSETQRTAELLAANRELEFFTAFASHDLRKPLQNIYANAYLLASEPGTVLGANGSKLIENIQNSSLHMGAILDSFMKLAHAGQCPLERQEVDMRSLVEQTARDLNLAGSSPAIVVRIGSLAATEGDPVLLRQVWVNLLSNALKFSRGKEAPMIEIGSVQEEKRTVYFVRDNGIGFEVPEEGRMFHAFQRMPTARKIAGNGLGLALVRRIIEHHDGQIWADSKPDEGATFFFSLPKLATSTRVQSRLASQI